MNIEKSSKKKDYILNDYNNGRPKLNDDFYGWVNYDWLKNNKIPDDESKLTHFTYTQLNINNDLRNIIESNIYPLGTILYNSYLDTKYKNEKCLLELKHVIKIVDMVSTYKDLITMAVRLLFINVSTLFNLSIDSNIYSSCTNILYITQPTLGLPDRAYYHDLKYEKIRQEYYNTIYLIYKNMYPEMSNDEIIELTSLIINIETKLAIIFLNNADKRQINSIYHEISVSDAINKYPNLHIDSIIKILCLLSDDIVIEENFLNIIMEHSSNPETDYFKQLENLLQIYTIEQWKKFYKFQIILSYINHTNQTMKDLFFNMFKKIIKGQKKPKKLWRSALSFTCSMFNDEFSRIYVHNFFNNDIENYIKEMVFNIKKITKERIKKLDWMSDITKKKALLKLHKLKLKIGYSKSDPRDHSHIVLTNSIIKNTIILNRDNFIYQLNKLNSPVDLNDWDLPSYVVNAYFNPSRNEIIFPAAILQPPFFDLTKSDIYNYANIGSVIAHEIIHSFDDQGSKFDENGSINDWWTDEDKVKFNLKVSQIIDIYNNEGVDGTLTAGENIADFGAASLPLFALKYKLNRKLNNNDIKEFYIAYARHWEYLLRKEAVDERKLSDPHSFADLRVNIPLKHQILFQKVFNIKPGNKMYIEEKDILNIW